MRDAGVGDHQDAGVGDHQDEVPDQRDPDADADADQPPEARPAATSPPGNASNSPNSPKPTCWTYSTVGSPGMSRQHPRRPLGAPHHRGGERHERAEDDERAGLGPCPLGRDREQEEPDHDDERPAVEHKEPAERRGPPDEGDHPAGGVQVMKAVYHMAEPPISHCGISISHCGMSSGRQSARIRSTQSSIVSHHR